jgi:hypothetical protein
MSDGGCAPPGATYCGGGRYCSGNSVCADNGTQCLARSSERVCSNGSYCNAGHVCMRDGRCLPTSSERYCGGGRYCEAGHMCTREGQCLSTRSERYCGNGRYCDAGYTCTANGRCQQTFASDQQRGGRDVASCEADFQRALEVFQSNGRQCGLSSSSMASLSGWVPGPNTRSAEQGIILYRPDHPNLFQILPPGDDRWVGVGNDRVRPNCRVGLLARNQQETFMECYRSYACGVGSINCARAMVRQGMSCGAAVQQCLQIPQSR